MRVIIEVDDHALLSDALAMGQQIMRSTKWDDWKVGYGWGARSADDTSYWVYRTKTGIGIRASRPRSGRVA